MTTTLVIDPALPPLQVPEKVLTPDQTGPIAEALRLLEVARAKAAEIESKMVEGYEAEKARGYHEGTEKAAIEASQHHLQVVLSTIAYLETMEGALAESVTNCLRNLIRDLPPAERVVQLAAKALQSIQQQTEIVLRVHPDDSGAVLQRLADLKRELSNVVRFEVRGDHTLSHGDCILETPIGVVNASLETQLMVLNQELAKRG